MIVVIDTADLFGDWNVVDVGAQMLPSLALTSLLILCDFCDTVLERRMQTWTTRYKLKVFICLAEAGAASLYALFAALVACQYAVGGFAPLRDFITDTRWTIVNILFVVFIVLDACTAFARGLFRLRRHSRGKHTDDKEKAKTVVPAALSLKSTEAPFEAVIDADKLNTTPAVKIDKKTV